MKKIIMFVCALLVPTQYELKVVTLKLWTKSLCEWERGAWISYKKEFVNKQKRNDLKQIGTRVFQLLYSNDWVFQF